MSDRTIVVTRSLSASPGEVFHALTDAEDLSRWWTTSAESDARTGGAYAYGFAFADSSRDRTHVGEYLDVTPGERVSYPWQAEMGPTVVDIRLRPQDEGTELTLTHSGWGEGAEADEAVELHEPIWGFFLDNLVAYLDRGEDLRPSAPMGQKTPATV
jgi:uncharacterized protein YndB with AHSA1/START domain